jgi:hypothetical protein
MPQPFADCNSDITPLRFLFLERIPKKLDDFFDKNTIQVIDLEHVLTETSDISDV